MSVPAQHQWICGGRAADRASQLGRAVADEISVDCHRRLRGPYSGTCVLLGAVAADAYDRWPELVDQHRPCLLYAAPALAGVIGPALPILTFSTPHDERTRFFG